MHGIPMSCGHRRCYILVSHSTCLKDECVWMLDAMAPADIVLRHYLGPYSCSHVYEYGWPFLRMIRAKAACNFFQHGASHYVDSHACKCKLSVP